MDVEMRHLRALVAVAEELNFTRAAARLHLTQQALSGQIRQLEERVGVRLVERDTRQVSLTAAGAALYERSRPLLAGTDEAVATARAAAGGPSLTIGFIAPLTHRIFAPVIERFAAARPDVELTVHFAGFLDPWGGLREREADVAILYGEFDAQGLQRRPLFDEPRGIALRFDHPLAASSEISLAEFVAEPIIAVPTIDPVARDFWVGAEHRGGVPPRVGASVQTLDGLVEATGAGLGVAVTVQAAVDSMGATAGTVFRPVTGLGPLTFWVAHAAGDERVEVREFADVAVSVCEGGEAGIGTREADRRA